MSQSEQGAHLAATEQPVDTSTAAGNPDDDPRRPWMSRSMLGLATAEQRPNLHFPIIDPATGISFAPPANRGRRYSKKRMQNSLRPKAFQGHAGDGATRVPRRYGSLTGAGRRRVMRKGRFIPPNFLTRLHHAN